MANPQQPDFDPGLTQRYTGELRRAINKDGSFNVLRRGVGLRDKGFYLHLMNSSWPWFLIQVGLAYTAVNVCFAGIYYWIGVDNLTGASRETPLDAFLSAFFFSVQTFTTVGYGHVSPHGLWTNVVAAFEAMTGLLGFALGTGLLYGRFSRPSAKIVFSRQDDRGAVRRRAGADVPHRQRPAERADGAGGDGHSDDRGERERRHAAHVQGSPAGPREGLLPAADLDAGAPDRREQPGAGTAARRN